jgi:tetratricopeptide (TPR) repeat protein
MGLESAGDMTSHSNSSKASAFSVLEEAELTLLCLDHLRELRRSYPPQTLETVEGLRADYLTIACWALNRAFVAPDYLTAEHGNDPFMKSSRNTNSNTLALANHGPLERSEKHILLPTLAEMEDEILIRDHTTTEEGDQKKEDEADVLSIYEYNDSHASNSHRFYGLLGLASGPSVRAPLSMAEIVAAGITGLGARSRIDAERQMIQSPLFQQFVHAVNDRGFFEDEESDQQQDKEKLYENRFRKVVAKFRIKLANKADMDGAFDRAALSAAQYQRQQRKLKMQVVSGPVDPLDLTPEAGMDSDIPTPTAYRMRKLFDLPVSFSARQGRDEDMDSDAGTLTTNDNPSDVDQAERLKNQGNSYMQKKEYALAADCYTAALKISPAGPNSHVYFSNRAAAFVSMKRFDEAVIDSERSLALKPDYGKAHARLGLTYFLLGNYRQAVEAYTVALKYEPDNKSSKTYLEKAARRLADGSEGHEMDVQPSFSIVSEWDKTPSHRSTVKTDSSVAHSQAMYEEREAERYKAKGNGYMASREYQLAVDAYAKAIELSSNGPHSHVYFSNRAAALCYLEQYEEAEEDSLRSLELNPNYSKAHARLGLSRFFMEDYAGAIEAYETALEKDPDNAASKSYLAKAKTKLEHGDVDKARRLSEDPHFRRMTAKVMSNPSIDLLDDPEMQNWVKQAMNDPTIKSVVNGQK